MKIILPLVSRIRRRRNYWRKKYLKFKYLQISFHVSRDVEEIFLGADSTVGFNGQPVGIVLADSFALANYAAKLVKITYNKKGLFLQF